MELLNIIALLIVLTAPQPVAANEVYLPSSYPDYYVPNVSRSVESIVREEFSDMPVMIEVARCESGFRQFKDGEVLRGVVNSQDVGVMQVNERYHLEESKRLGINIYTLEGNLEYAKRLYESSGTQPWSASRHCWQK